MIMRCPGSDKMRTPTLALRKCPVCGKDVEAFSTDPIIRCAACGWTSENSIQSCYNWCKYADQCREDAKK